MRANYTRKDSIPDTVCGLGSNFQARKTRIVLIARGLKLDNKAYQEKVLDKLVPEKALWQRVHIHARRVYLPQIKEHPTVPVSTGARVHPAQSLATK